MGDGEGLAGDGGVSAGASGKIAGAFFATSGNAPTGDFSNVIRVTVDA